MDSDSDSSSDSETSVSAAKSARPGLPRALQALEARATAVLAQQAQPLPVPPGEGKPITQSRNARRRRKKLAEKEAAERETAAGKALSDPNSMNAIPLGVRASNTVEKVTTAELSQAVSAVQVNAEQRVGLSLANKNKKRGFKKAMVNIVPERIIFSKESESRADGVNAENSRTQIPVSQTTAKPPRLVTPSEKQALGLLPANMLVTSVELENDGQGKWDRRKKKKMRDVYSGEEQPEAASVGVQLDYGTPDNVGGDSMAASSRDAGAVDWAAVEQKWDQFSVIENCTTIDAEQLVGWKTLGINPETCTPEMLVQLARAESVDHMARKVNILLLARPGTEDIGFRGTRHPNADEEEHEEQDAEEEENFERDTVDFVTILSGQWRLVNV